MLDRLPISILTLFLNAERIENSLILVLKREGNSRDIYTVKGTLTFGKGVKQKLFGKG